MKFALFAGGRYYPNGGWNDFIASAETIDECKTIADAWIAEPKAREPDNYSVGDSPYWCHIVVLASGSHALWGLGGSVWTWTETDPED